MRVILILLLWGYGLSAHAQDDKGHPNFREVFVSMENQFRLFKGALIRVSEDDSMYHSDVEIEKTQENQIIKSGLNNYSYYALVGRELTLDSAKKLMAEWNAQIKQMAKGFKLETLSRGGKRNSFKSYLYRKAEKKRRYIVHLFYQRVDETNNYVAILQLSTNQ